MNTDAKHTPATREVVAADAILPNVNCADEPIHLPGSIQRHGFLLMFDPQTEVVEIASANADEFLQVPMKLLLGTSLDTILEREVLAVVRSIRTLTDDSLMYLGGFRLKGELCSVVTHRIGRWRVLEFEKLDRLVIPEIMNSVITNFVGKLSKIGSALELCQAITRQVQELTGFNRVMLYSFDEAGHGTVLAEENDGTLPSYLDLRFPATDIPQQARRLYVENTIRIIPDATYEPAALMSVSGQVREPVDLSHSVLRSVSPVHLEYMKNMGTMSSMSVSILCEGKLWGLIGCHHATPRTVPYLVRSACDMLTKIVGTQLSAFRQAMRLEQLLHFHAVQRSLLTEIAADASYVHALTRSLDDLRVVTGAGGAAVLLEDEISRTGQTPNEEEISRILEWLDENPKLELFETAELRSHLPWAESISDVASGMIAIRVSDVRRNYVLWFRPEVVQTVRWAGEPVKYVDAKQGLHPRESFESWKQTVRGQSEPWTGVEVESAREFRAALITIGLKRAEEAVELSEARFRQLTHALPALVWTASDDGRLTYVNDRWRELGLATMGRWFDVVSMPAEDAARVAMHWVEAVADGGPFEEEVRIAGADRMERWHLVRAVPFQASGGQRAGWVGTFTDTTDRREREAALRMAEKLATTGRMTSVIAHEINNPLESITNLMYLLRGELKDAGPGHEYIALAESELERISGITKQTLRWGRERPEREERLSASAMFDDVVRLFAGKIRNREVRLERREGKDVSFSAVGGQIRQVVANLLANAIDAVPVGGAVWLDARQAGQWIELIVGDAGSGMTEDQKGHLFKPFVTTKGDLGNGLGLYISQEIVDRHHGKLLVHSVVGGGTTMTVQLP